MDPLHSTAPGFFVPVRDPSSKDPLAPFPLNGVDLGTVSNEQLISIGESAPVIYSLMSTKVVRLSVNLVLKFGAAIQMQEIEAMSYVLAKTQVPTPRLHRYFFTQPASQSFQYGYMVMDYVDGGNTLFDIWHTVSQEKREDVIRQTARIVTELQSVHFDQPGPLGGGRCRGYWFSDYGAGPFANKKEFNDWLSHKLEISQRVGLAGKDLPPFDHSSFVLVHHDISPQNLMLDPSGKVWIIDWGNAGAYPAIFEAARLNEGSRFPDFDALLLPYMYNDIAERQQLLGIRWGITIAACQ